MFDCSYNDSSAGSSLRVPVIRVLPDQVVNQIAAGEVIERPAAVVKELLENSLDAGATQVTIEFKHGGKSYIRVEDNGCGMTPDAALLALERHATSKLRAADDLLSIDSLGFRGEALPSIASVSRFTLKTRAADWQHGSEVFVNGGKLIHQRDYGMPVGTRIEVAHLFNSVPARRKFLKTDATEAAHIVQLVRLHAVARPHVAFELIENDRTVFKTPLCPSQRDRIQEIWGSSLARDLLDLEPVYGDGLELKGLIGKPGVARPSRREWVTLVNGRPVDSRTLNYAALEAYHTLIPKGKFPLGFILLTIDPAAVDVNIHPAKREVRFRDEGRVRQFVIRALLKALRPAANPQIQPAEPSEKPVDSAAAAAAELQVGSRKNLPEPDPLARPFPNSGGRPAPDDFKRIAMVPERVPEPAFAAVHQANEPAPRPINSNQPMAGLKDSSGEPVAVPALKSALPNWRLVGRIQGGIAVFETPGGLVLLHVRAAHQRILYERIARACAQAQGVQQLLLVPLSMEWEPLAAAVLAEHLEFFQEIGFQLECFGRNFYRLLAHPDWIPEAEVEDFIRDLVADIGNNGFQPQKKALAHAFIAGRAASKAVRLNDALSDQALLALVEDLLACEQPLVCHQGKPTFFEMSTKELQKKFGLS